MRSGISLIQGHTVASYRFQLHVLAVYTDL